METPSSLKERVADVRERIGAALERSGRSGENVTIVGITKTVGADRVMELIRAGISDIGENRIQEFLEKMPRITLPCRWHLVGTLQRNKAKKALGKFSLIHSIDSIKLAQTLSRLGRESDLVTRALIEINTSGESSKHGFMPDEAIDFLGQAAELSHLTLEGLMTIGPLTNDSRRVREAFKKLYELRNKARDSLGMALPVLSMGMTDDFEIAVEEGATMVRLGRVLLGERHQS